MINNFGNEKLTSRGRNAEEDRVYCIAIPQISIPTSREVSRCQIFLISDQRWAVDSMQSSGFSSSSFLDHPLKALFSPTSQSFTEKGDWMQTE